MMRARASHGLHILPESPLGFFVFVLPVLSVILFALWLAAAAAVENVRFAQTTSQLLSIISMLRDDAAKEPAFGLQPGEDMVATLIRRGQIVGSGNDPQTWLLNSWRGAIRVTITQPTMARLETDLPAADCRRMALFFGRARRDAGLQRMEARGSSGNWRALYDNTAADADPEVRAIDAACGQEPQASLALLLRLR